LSSDVPGGRPGFLPQPTLGHHSPWQYQEQPQWQPYAMSSRGGYLPPSQRGHAMPTRPPPSDSYHPHHHHHPQQRLTTTVTSSPITGVDQPVAVPLAVPSGATASGALTVQRPSAAAATPTPSTTGNGTPTLRSRLPTEQAGRVPPRPVIGVVRGATSAVVGTMRPFCGRGHRREHHSHQNVGRSPARRTSRARSQPRRVSLR
jgi:hypothetical protein